MRAIHTSAAVLALAALTGSQAAQAKATQCVTEPEVAGLIRFAMPSLIDGITGTCSAHLSASGFFAVSGDAMRAKYVTGQDDAWPLAKSAFVKIGGSDAFSAVPDEALKPLLMSMISEKLTEEIKPDDCGDIEHVFEVADRIAPDDFSALAGAIFAVAVGDKDKSVPICKNR